MVMKICSDCGETKPLSAFVRDKYAKDGHRNYCKACRSLKDSKRIQLRSAPKDGVDVDFPPELLQPEDDIEVKELIDQLCRRAEKRLRNQFSKRWFPVRIHTDAPFGLAFVGDPHIDDNGCNWPLLRADVDSLSKHNKYVFAINLGDVTNNWIGRLSRLWAESDCSKTTAYKLVEWFIRESGINWLLWIGGNHDLWGDGFRVLKGLGAKFVPMEEWQAQFELVCDNKRAIRVWAAHDFPGSSIWNSLHSAMRAFHTKSPAHIYACGHTHNWAIHQEESASRGFTSWLIRARGYKYIDTYAEKLGHFPQQEGATILAVIRPNATSEAQLIQCFASVEAGVDYLSWIRSKKSE